MVTQIYTAPLKSYNPQGQMGFTPPLAPQRNSTGMSASEEDAGQGQSRTLAALQDQSKSGVISIRAVLADFHSTMDALGVSQNIRDEVAPYLQVVAHQSQSTQPVTGLVKQNLRIAGDTLDQFISTTLGQKSHVVREWVDALLLQPINYKSDSPISVDPPQNVGSNQLQGPSLPSETLTQGLSDSKISQDDQQFIKQSLQDAKTALKAQDTDQAMGDYQGVLDKLQGKSVPQVQGRVLYQMGKVMDKTNQLDKAEAFYKQANQVLSTANNPQLQSKVSNALAMNLSQQGDYNGAVDSLKQVLVLETQLGNVDAQGATLNQMGMFYMRLGQGTDAKNSFEDALSRIQGNNSKLASDIYSNLGALAKRDGKRSQAFSYYKQSLETASLQNDKDGVRQTLQNIASLYLDSGKPEKALKILQNALI